MKCLLILYISIQRVLVTSASEPLSASSAHFNAQSQPHRRRLAPAASIIDELNSQLTSGIEHPRFTLTASRSPAENSNLFNDANPFFEIDVVLTNPSVSKSTTFSVDGNSSSVKNPIKLLVADRIDRHHSSGFAILAVNEENGSVSGIVQKDKQLLKLEQLRGGRTVVTEVNYDPPKNWTCLVDSLQHGSTSSLELREKHAVHRRKTRQLYATDTFPNAWSYQVDLYIQVDDAFVQYHDTDTTNMPNSIDYINALVTAV
jgi:hypothetical protein